MRGAQASPTPTPTTKVLQAPPWPRVLRWWGQEVEALYTVFPFASKGFGRAKRARRQVAQGN